MTRKHTGLDFADLIVAQYGNDSLSIVLETVRQVHIRLSRQTTRLREVKTDDVSTQQRIINATCEHFGLLQKELYKHGGSRRLCYARRVCWALMRDRLKMSLYEIGDRFDRDHTAVMTGMKRADVRCKDYEEIARTLDGGLIADVLLPAGPVLELEAG